MWQDVSINKQKKGRQMASRFDYVKYDQASIMVQERAKKLVTELEFLICGGPDGFSREPTRRPQALALTALEECYMWIGKAIRDTQIERNGSAESQEERNNE